MYLKGFVMAVVMVNVLRAIGAVDALMSYGREWFHYSAYVAHLMVDLVIVLVGVLLLMNWELACPR